MPPRPPRMLSLAFSLLCAIAILSALFRAWQGLSHTPPNWFLLGFEAIVVLGALLGLFVAKGDVRGFREGPALGMACVAGAVLVASACGGASILGGFRDLASDPFTLARFALAGAMGALGALAVLIRRPRASFRSLVIGCVLSALALGVAVAISLPATRNAASNVNPILVTVGVLVLGLLIIGLLSAGVHFAIRAFEMGDTTSEKNAPTAKAS